MSLQNSFNASTQKSLNSSGGIDSPESYALIWCFDGGYQENYMIHLYVYVYIFSVVPQ